MSLLLLALAGAPLDAQVNARDTPSHRFLPLGEAPQRNSFLTPEYEQAKETYRMMRDLRRELNRSRRSSSEAADLPTFDPGIAEQLAPETQELLREWSKDSVAEMSRQIGREIVELNQKFTQRAGTAGTAGSTQEPAEIPFDFSRDILQRIDDARQAYREQNRDVNLRYQEAMRQFRDKWPSEKIPPQEWLDRVQPFINSEVLHQLSQVRDFRDGKLTKPPEIPEQLVSNKPTAGFSQRMIDSMVKSIDQGSSEWIKRAQRKNQGKKKQTSWWKRWKSDADARLKSLNKSITDRSESYATSSALTQNTPSSLVPRTGGPPVTDASRTPYGPWLPLLGLGAVLATVGYGLYRRHAQRISQANAVGRILDVDAIRDGDTLLQAIHGLALQHLGNKSRYWHHRRLFDSLHEKLGAPYAEIAALYERTRYAPGNRLSAEDLEVVRRWYRHALGTRAMHS